MYVYVFLSSKNNACITFARGAPGTIDQNQNGRKRVDGWAAMKVISVFGDIITTIISLITHVRWIDGDRPLSSSLFRSTIHKEDDIFEERLDLCKLHLGYY